MGRDGQTLRAGCLRFNPAADLFGAGRITGDRPFELDLWGHVNDDDGIEPVGTPGLDQQRDHVHHDRPQWCGFLQIGSPGPDPRMQDRLQVLPRCRIAEYETGQRGSVQTSVGPQHLGPEAIGDRGQTRRTRFDNLPGEDIGIDDDGPEIGPMISHG